MDRILDIIPKLQLGFLLILVGAFFLILACVNKIGGFIEIDDKHHFLAFLIGIFILGMGISISLSTPCPQTNLTPCPQKPPNPSISFSEKDAISIINLWNNSKGTIFKSPYDASLLKQYLTGARLSRAIEDLNKVKNDQSYYVYDFFNIDVIPNSFHLAGNKASITVLEREDMKYCKKNSCTPIPNKKPKRETFYSFEFSDNSWKIANSKYID